MVDDTDYGFTWEWVPLDADRTGSERGHWRCTQFPEARVYPPPLENGIWTYEYPGLDRPQVFFRGDWRQCFVTIGYRIARAIRRPEPDEPSLAEALAELEEAVWEADQPS
jgi:hypothetical protein